MSAGLAISGITKDFIFSGRRASQSYNADSLPVSIGNANIASGQIKNAVDGIAEISKESKSILAANFRGAQEAISGLAKESAILDGAGKVIGFTADHINPVITVVGGLKVLNAKDKKDALIEEGLGIATMFAFEGIAKNELEMDKKVKDPITGEIQRIKRNAYYKKNPFLKAQSENIEKAITDYVTTKKLFNKISLKPLPGITKGLMFVGASIAGYQTGKELANTINKKRKENSAINSENKEQTAAKNENTTVYTNAA